jgi:transketolase
MTQNSAGFGKLTKEELTLFANTIRMLSADGVEKAASGHPGMPMGMADLAAVVWLKYLRLNPKDLHWLNRDRFVVSNGHGSMLLYSLLHLFGMGLSIDDLKAFRQWGSKTPGHPESHLTPGIECTTGPLGQGISNAVGMAIGEKLLASRYNAGSDPIDNRVFVFAGDGCLMEGVSSEASSVAGHLGLGNLIVIYDDNHISIAGSTDLAFTEDVLKRYEAYGWHTDRVDGHDYDAIDGAIARALAVTDKPSLIAARTIIGKGSPNKQGTRHVHGEPLGKDELSATKKNLNWPEEPTFFVPEKVRAVCAGRVEELQQHYQAWQQKFEAWGKAHPEKKARLEKQLARAVPTDLREQLLSAVPTDGKPVSTRKLSGTVLQKAVAVVDSLVGGSADLEPSTLTLIEAAKDVQKDSFGGLNLRFGVREHGMGAIMNGLSYYGGFIPYGSTFMCFSDYMRPTIRLAALSEIPGLFIFTHESVFLGEDGPTHQPIEHLNSLRMIPHLWVMRPADGVETAVCYAKALARRDGPALMAFTRQNLTPLPHPPGFDPAVIEKGGYVVVDSAGQPDLVLIGTGSEVSLAVDAAKALSAKAKVRVVSIPCLELFKAQDQAYRREVLPPGVRRVVIEAGSTFGWQQSVEGDTGNTLLIGIDHFGASAPAKILAEKFGLTPEAVAARVTAHFAL